MVAATLRASISVRACSTGEWGGHEMKHSIPFKKVGVEHKGIQEEEKMNNYTCKILKGESKHPGAGIGLRDK